jgi:hypothetical protein
MLFLLLSFFYQAFAHYFDWRHLFRQAPPQPAFLVLNYVIGCTGISLAYITWLTLALSAPTLTGWLLLTSLDPRLMFAIILVANGATVVFCYTLDAFVLNRNRLNDSRDEIALLSRQISELEDRLHATPRGA